MDAFFKAAVTLVPDCLITDDGKEPEGNAAVREAYAREEALVGLLSSGIGFLVAVPGHPKHGPFFLAQGALNVIQSAKWRLPSSKCILFGNVPRKCATKQKQLKTIVFFVYFCKMHIMTI